MRMEAAEHVADNARRFDRPRAGGEAHLVHREQDPALHRLLAVGTVGQRASFDHRDRVVEIRALRELRQRQRVVVRAARRK